MEDGNQNIFSVFHIESVSKMHASMFCCNQSVKICTEHKILYSLEMYVICYLNKQMKKSETTLVLSGEVVFMS